MSEFLILDGPNKGIQLRTGTQKWPVNVFVILFFLFFFASLWINKTGSPGGGARPEDNHYIAAMAPEDTTPVAIFPPFDRSPDYPTKCVIFSQLTDFEEAHISEYGNDQVNFWILTNIPLRPYSHETFLQTILR